MKAGVWFAAGAAAGVYGMVRARRLAEAFTPDGMSDRIGAAFLGARLFGQEVARGSATAEVHLRQRFDGAAGGPRRLTAPPADGERRRLAPSTTTTAAPAAPDTEEGSIR